MTLRPQLRARVLSATREQTALTRRQLRLRRAAALLIPLAALTAITLTNPLGRARLVDPQAWGPLIAPFCAGLVATWLVFGPSASTLGRPRPALRAIAPLLVLVLLFSSLAWGGFASDAWGSWGHATEHAPCFLKMLLFSFAPLGLWLLVDRRSDPVDPAVSGTAYAAVAASWSACVLALACPNEATVSHVGLAHVAPVAALALAGGLIGARVLALRRS